MALPTEQVPLGRLFSGSFATGNSEIQFESPNHKPLSSGGKFRSRDTQDIPQYSKAPFMEFKSEFLMVARIILEQEKKPMRPREIVDAAIGRGLFSDRRAGKTPHQTMKSKLSVHVRRKGNNSFFVRTGPGKFYLRYLIEEDQKIFFSSPWRKPNSKENVLTFRSDRIGIKNRLQGIRKTWKKIYKSILRPDVSSYIERLAAENDNLHKQVLTYIMVTKRDKVLAYKRGNFNRVEDFLRGSYCIGFGGHVAENDRELFSSADMGVKQSAIRELSEELKLPDEDKKRLTRGIGLRVVGVLNDDSSIVGQRHFAFLFQYEVSDDSYWEKPERGEKSITQLRWLGPNLPPIPILNFEYWSQLCLREFFSSSVIAAPAHRIRRRRLLTPPHVLCVVGELGSGKSETTKLLCKEFGYTEINTGQLMATLLCIPPVPETPREAFQKAAWKFINSPDGPDRLASAIWEKALMTGSERLLVDGIRQRTTLDRLQSHARGKNVGVLFIHTLPDLAYRFYRDREQKRISFFEFLRLREAEVEKEVSGMISLADAVLYNWMGLNEYRKAVRFMVTQILGA